MSLDVETSCFSYVHGTWAGRPALPCIAAPPSPGHTPHQQSIQSAARDKLPWGLVALVAVEQQLAALLAALQVVELGAAIKCRGECRPLGHAWLGCSSTGRGAAAHGWLGAALYCVRRAVLQHAAADRYGEFILHLPCMR